MDELDPVRTLFDCHVDEGLHHGAQLAVYADGELVLDLAGGTTGPDGEPTTSDRPHLLFSCTKPLAGVCLHQLVEVGRLEYDDPVRDHWPEFADPGTEKATATVRHVLSHQAGLPAVPIDAEPDRWNDWGAITASVADTEVDFAPGSTAAYHALSYGWLVGELVRRVSGDPIDEYLAENVFDPLGMDDTSIGPATDPDAVATLVAFDEFERARSRDDNDVIDGSDAAPLFDRPSVQRAVVPAANGVGSARDLARFYACLADGGELDGTRLLDPETVERATELQIEVDEDGTLGIPRRNALGFERAGTVWDDYGTLAPDRVFGHGGLGSSVNWADPHENLAMAYVTNGVRDDYVNHARLSTMGNAVRQALC